MNRNPDAGTVFADPEELNDYVKRETEREVQESLDKIERDQRSSRNEHDL